MDWDEERKWVGGGRSEVGQSLNRVTMQPSLPEEGGGFLVIRILTFLRKFY